METQWLEDFISLAETHSLSRSAELRHIGQPAFACRIQSLEAWLGADLIDRTSYPTRLTAAGEVFYTQAIEMLSQINGARAVARQAPSRARHGRFRSAAHLVADLDAEVERSPGTGLWPRGFLPESALQRELRYKHLARADGGRPGWEAGLEIRPYRERPSPQRPGRPLIGHLWEYVMQHGRPDGATGSRWQMELVGARLRVAPGSR